MKEHVCGGRSKIPLISESQIILQIIKNIEYKKQ
jgi:hypothetical protein